ncbi:hypothetical protein GCM10008986_14300 [Salinibacillus aidingensis]|uniref:Uncharacterized protein n=1 Tax=Salinibacillus aidingensis TaxID=237684 RepID=A0ABN1B3N2_9BACI
MEFILNLIEYLFSSKKTLVYTAMRQQDYYKAVSKLEADLIKFRVSVTGNANASPGTPYSDLGRIYKIYVRKEDEGKALRSIHTKR